MTRAIAGLAGLALVLAACGVDRNAQATQMALHDLRGTEIADLRDTATFAADQRLVTLEFLATAGTQAISRQRQVIATLNALGVSGDISQITPPPTPTPPPAALDNPDGAPLVLDTAPLSASLPQVRGGVTLLPSTPEFRTRVPTAEPPTPIPPPAIATIDPTRAHFDGVVTATRVGNDDCAPAGSVTTTFSPQASQIYVVAIANRVSAGMRLGSRWFRDGQEVAYFEFTPNFPINGNCVWFFAEQSDFPFAPSDDYSVVLEIDGQAIGAPARFRVADD